MKESEKRIPLHTTISKYTAEKLQAFQERYSVSPGRAVDMLLILLEDRTGKTLEALKQEIRTENSDVKADGQADSLF